MTGVLEVVAEIVSARPEGTRHRLTLAVRRGNATTSDAGVYAGTETGTDAGRSGLAVAPGQFVALPPAPGSGRVLADQVWLAGSHHDPVHGDSWEVIWDGPLPESPDRPRVWIGPLGRPLPRPADPVPTLVLGDGTGQGAARWLAAALTARSVPVTLVLSAHGPDDHLDLASARRATPQAWVIEQSGLHPALDRIASAQRPALVYAIADPEVSRQVAVVAAGWGAVSQVTAFSPGGGGCGTGLCGKCVLTVPVRGEQRRVTPCVDGPGLPGQLLVGQR